MKMSDLVRKTGVQKETIHYYIREGLLPKPRKLGPNSAEYTTEHVEYLQTIKEFQTNFHLPLSAIKKIFRKYADVPHGRNLLRIKAEYFQPLELMLPQQIRGEKEFIAKTSLKPEGLERLEHQGIISPRIIDGEKVYSQDDLTIGKVIVEMRHIGVSPEYGYDTDVFKQCRDLMEQIVDLEHREFMKVEKDRLTEEEIRAKAIQAFHVLGAYYYHLYSRLAHEKFERSMAAMTDDSSGDSAGRDGETE